MRRQTFVALAGSIAIAIGGCSGDGSNTASSPSPAASPSPTITSSPTASPKPGQTQPFAKPLTVQAPAPGLLQATKPGDRVKEIEKRIKDNRVKGATAVAFGTGNPFNSVPLQATSTAPLTSVVPDLPSAPPTQDSPFTAFPPPPVSLRPPSVVPRRRPTSPTNSPTPPRRRPTVARRPTTTPRRTQLPPTVRRPSRTPAGIPRPSSRPPIARRPATPPPQTAPSATQPGGTAFVPPRPTTTLADAIAVSGVIRVNGRVFAIVQENASTPSIYVRVGQRLANGLVLVKRIELNPGGEPVVVLEENGVEVRKIVGEGVSTGQVTT